ncbi:hypothetical protein FRC12_000236 [Ceratobasidium sp. 428]|nr:hypothetical protein FRC09_015779 [Ceratobasidium sp. 395]KAG8777734.1 hypothetical protein FRC12_000236 [Ceratobasidium sp. 428]
MPSQGLLSGMYLIQNVMTKTGMDASEETGLVASWEIKEEDHQKWHVARMGDEWVIQHKRTLKYATAPNVAAGAILELTDEASVRYNIIQADNAYK